MESVVTHQIANNEAEQKAFYRLLHNPRVSMDELINYITSDCSRQVESGKHYIVFQDTTQPNLEKQRDRIKAESGLGVIARRTVSDNRSLGFFLHGALAVEASSERCIGYGHIEVWSRPICTDNYEARGARYQPLQQKESYRWLESMIQSRKTLQHAAQVTMVSDREGDIYECFSQASELGVEVLIRSRADRKVLTDDGQKHAILSYLRQSPCLGSYELTIEADKRQHRIGREAHIEVRAVSALFTPPQHIAKTYPPVEVYIVEAREQPESVPQGQEPVHWVLVTTHQVTTFQQACQVIQWYGLRWNIEQVFRLLKTKGFNVEASQLEEGDAIIRSCLLAMLGASKIVLLHRASKQQEAVPIQQSFTTDQQACMRLLCSQYEGKTLRQKNPYPANSLQWCYWVIARLGGWKPMEKQAGVIVLFRGWQRFWQIYQGWVLAHPDVSKQ
jgi:hypothetical protein